LLDNCSKLILTDKASVDLGTDNIELAKEDKGVLQRIQNHINKRQAITVTRLSDNDHKQLQKIVQNGTDLPKPKIEPTHTCLRILAESIVLPSKTFQQVTDLINSLLINIDLKLFLYDGFGGFELFEEFLGLGLAC
jgi:hypothetical protein